MKINRDLLLGSLSILALVPATVFLGGVLVIFVLTVWALIESWREGARVDGQLLYVIVCYGAGVVAIGELWKGVMKKIKFSDRFSTRKMWVVIALGGVAGSGAFLIGGPPLFLSVVLPLVVPVTWLWDVASRGL